MSKYFLTLIFSFCLSSLLIGQNDLYNPQPDTGLDLKKWQENIQSKIKNSDLFSRPDSLFKVTRCKLKFSDKHSNSLYIRKFVRYDFRLLVMQENDTTSTNT